MMNEIDLPTLPESEDRSCSFTNCIKNNYRHIRKWAKRTSTNCFRIYDRHMHHYPLAIDYYGGKFCVHYFLQRKENDEPSQNLIQETNEILIKLFGCIEEDIFWRARVRRKKTEQYEKLDSEKEFFNVFEFGLKFRVNLVDYLDTGLFLDHRESRKLVSTFCKDKRLLNLFAYTSAFSVHAAANGARFTKSVDLSNTYCEWSRDNFLLNDLSLTSNEILRADCMEFLNEERLKYDVIVIDPPTVSRSKKMKQLFDVQKDYVFLISQSLQLLNSDGLIFFSTNLRKFVFDETLFADCSIFEITNKTLPLDFHDNKIHRSWKIMKNK